MCTRNFVAFGKRRNSSESANPPSIDGYHSSTANNTVGRNQRHPLWLTSSITANPFISIRQLQRVMMETMHLDVSTELLRIAIHRMVFSRKKARHTCRPSHLPVKTSEFLRLRDLYQDQRRKFVAIDETSFGRNGLFTVGWSKRANDCTLSER